MEIPKTDFFIALKASIDHHFGFLKEHGFSDFTTTIVIGYEVHIESGNEFIKIDFCYEYSPVYAPIWAQFDRYRISHLEPDNLVVKEYDEMMCKDGDLFDHYLETEDMEKYYEICKTQYIKFMQCTDAYLKELSEIVKRHITVLGGDQALLIANAKIADKEYALKKKTNV